MTHPCPDCKSPARGNPCWYNLDHPDNAKTGFDPPCYVSDTNEETAAHDRRFPRAWALLFFVAILLWLYSLASAHAQEHHERHHTAYYQNWVNGKDGGCCNDQDCGELADADERTTGGRLEVRIDGQWCEIQPWHYLKRGNAPNAASAHICVQRNYSGTKGSECDRLLCYQPKPGI